MAVTLKHTRKVVVVGWDTDLVKGSHASIQIKGEEKRNVNNDGTANLYFPASFAGDIDVTVVGSKEGKDTGTITVK
jgi:hypothetical protein